MLGRAPDIITGADVIYEEQHYPALLATLAALAAPHTLVFLASRLRGKPQTLNCLGFLGMPAASGFSSGCALPAQRACRFIHELSRNRLSELDAVARKSASARCLFMRHTPTCSAQHPATPAKTLNSKP